MLRFINKYLSLFLLIICSLEAHAAGDSTNIGISVTIKASQQCDFGYSLERQIIANSDYKHSSSCDVNRSILQKHLEQISYSNITTPNAQTDEKRYRVLMTVE